MSTHLNFEHQSPKLLLKKGIPESTKGSLMSMMRQIMEKSCIKNKELQYIAEESVEDSVIQSKETEGMLNMAGRNGQPYRLNSHIQTGRRSDAAIQSERQQELSKLIQITGRCINYYNDFVCQKNCELQIVEKAFSDLDQNLNSAFEDMVSELLKKQTELRQFLIKKHRHLVAIRHHQQASLQQALTKIKNLHLTKFVRSPYPEPLQNPQSLSSKQNLASLQLSSPTSQSSAELSIQLHSYASTLNNFYLLMEQVEAANFKQTVEECVSFINNLVAQEIRVTLHESIPARLTEKRMILQNSKDFLLQSSQSSFNNKNDQLEILDIDSFTLLFDPQQFQENTKPQNTPLSSNSNPSTPKQFCEKDKTLNLLGYMTTSKTINSPNRKYPQGVFTEQITYEQQNKVAKGDFTKKQPYPVIMAWRQKQQKNNRLNGQKYNELELIKKISNQQSNRSAKIKSYLVTFQSQKPKPQKTIQHKKININSERQNCKSSQKVSRTPTKLNRSSEKKVLSSHIIVKGSTDQKLTHSQQTTVKSYRNTAYVSQFKINSSRRQSLTANR